MTAAAEKHTPRTRQEIFDLAWNGLKAQGFRQSADDGSCLYRGPDGLKCAIGHCIPDERYSPGLEGAGVRTSLNARRAAMISSEDVAFAAHLQECHDGRHGTASPADMEASLRGLASIHGLTISSIA